MDLNDLIKKSQVNTDSSADQAQQTPKKETKGRKNRGQTLSNYEEYKKDLRVFRHTEQPEKFNSDLIERVSGEIVEDSSENFEELYKLTCDSILTQFIEENTELVKKHPYNWYKRLLIQLKKNTPKIYPDEIDKCFIVWDALKELLNTIGLYITYEAFEMLTNIYKYQLKDRQELSPKYREFLKKIEIDSNTALIGELSYNPYNQTNKIFLAKVHGIVEKTEPKQIEVHHDIRNYNNLPMFNEGQNE